ncbi:hypothetical protein FPV67DRAFT_1449647 [Lyophyllum atratum]|nr:hypothetical protein FPV67DRAFT_1449647 [Lyophyllum atratum]
MYRVLAAVSRANGGAVPHPPLVSQATLAPIPLSAALEDAAANRDWMNPGGGLVTTRDLYFRSGQRDSGVLTQRTSFDSGNSCCKEDWPYGSAYTHDLRDVMLAISGERAMSWKGPGAQLILDACFTLDRHRRFKRSGGAPFDPGSGYKRGETELFFFDTVSSLSVGSMGWVMEDLELYSDHGYLSKGMEEIWICTRRYLISFNPDHISLRFLEKASVRKKRPFTLRGRRCGPEAESEAMAYGGTGTGSSDGVSRLRDTASTY